MAFGWLGQRSRNRREIGVAGISPRCCTVAAQRPQCLPGAFLTLRVLPANYKISVVGLPGLEPGTSSLSEKRSNRLSYRPSMAESPTGPLYNTRGRRTRRSHGEARAD